MLKFEFCPCCRAPLVARTIQNEPRRVCSADCGFIHYDNPTPVVAAVVEHDGKVVLAHNRAWPTALKTFYGLITGFLERDETPEQCAVREVKEELNLDGSTPALIGVYSFPQMNQVIIAYHVAATGVIALNEELDEYCHLAFSECRVWQGGTGLALRDWLRTKGIDPPTRELPLRDS